MTKNTHGTAGNAGLQKEEARVASRLESDVAHGLGPQDDPKEAQDIERLTSQDPTFGAKLDDAIVAGEAEWEKNGRPVGKSGYSPEADTEMVAIDAALRDADPDDE